jgi:hypothetical protein
MPLFQKKTPEPEPPQGGGKDAIRAMARARTRTPGAMNLLREELHLSNEAIAAFAAGGDNLSPAQIDRLLAYFAIPATYDVTRDVLVSKAAPASSVCAGYPPPAVGRTLEEIVGPPRSFASLASATSTYRKSPGWA